MWRHAFCPSLQSSILTFIYIPSCQGYPQALLPLTVAGIPSIHICLDFIPELLAQPQLEKQVRPPIPLVSGMDSFKPNTPFFCSPTCFFVALQIKGVKKGCCDCLCADICHPAVVVPLHPVRLTQISQCGQVGHQRHGNPSDR